MSLFLSVGAMAQHYKVGQSVTDIATGYYVVVGTFNPGNGTNVKTGPIYYDASLQNTNYRLDQDNVINTNDILTDGNYVWYVEKNGETITLKNVQDNAYFVKDVDKNQNFSGTETANLYLEKVVEDANDKRYYLHLEDQNIGYIHCNQPEYQDPCLSYWPAKAENSSTSVRFEFYAVEQEFVVSSLSDFKQNKYYTVSTPSRGGWSVNEAGDNFCSTNDNGFGTTVDAANTQNQFAVLTIDNENYYLFSVHANKFVKADRSLVEEAGDAIKFENASSMGAGRVLVSFKNHTDKYINIGGQKQMVIDGWGDGYNEIDAGNAVKFVEAGDFDPKEALAMLAGDKGELLEAITEANELLEEVADYALIKADKIDIAGNITSNAGQNYADGNVGGTDDGAGIAGLTDNDPATYFHSRWGGKAVNEAHYLQIDLGSNLDGFCFEYAVRKNGNANETSPAPTVIEVRVSENGTDFGEPVVTLAKEVDNLPGYSDLGAALWSSNIISANKGIRYVRLTVTDSEGPGNNTWEGQKFFAMGTLNMYSAKYTEDYSVAKDEYKGQITNEQISAAVNALKSANEIFNNIAATQDEIDNATTTLNDALNVLKTASISHTLAVTAAGWATLFLDYNTVIPSNVKAYIVSSVNSGYVTLTQVTGVLPKHEGVLVEAKPGNYDFVKTSEGSDVDYSSNWLEGTLIDADIQKSEGWSYYVLGMVDGEVGLYKPTYGDDNTKFKNGANKAYLVVKDSSTAPYYSFRFEGEGTTAIENVEVENEVKAIYDLTGRRVEEITAPGIYIVNGKKVLVK